MFARQVRSDVSHYLFQEDLHTGLWDGSSKLLTPDLLFPLIACRVCSETEKDVKAFLIFATVGVF
jgi:hypothetical protein